MNFNHLLETNETYFVHAIFALKLCITLLLLCVVAFIHALIPFILTKTVSQQVDKLREQMKARGL